MAILCIDLVSSYFLHNKNGQSANAITSQFSMFRGSHPSCIVLRITARSRFPVMLPRSVWKLLTYLKNSVSFFYKKWQHSIHRRKHEIKTNTCDLGYIIITKKWEKNYTYVDQFFNRGVPNRILFSM